jgi:hypothetical protein
VGWGIQNLIIMILKLIAYQKCDLKDIMLEEIIKEFHISNLNSEKIFDSRESCVISKGISTEVSERNRTYQHY